MRMRSLIRVVVLTGRVYPRLVDRVPFGAADSTGIIVFAAKRMSGVLHSEEREDSKMLLGQSQFRDDP